MLAADAIAGWVPPPHAAPALSAITDPVVAIIAFLARYRFFMMPLFAVLLPMFLAWLGGRAKAAGRPGRSHVGIIVLCCVFGISNVMFGPWWSTLLVYHTGVSGAATVTSSRATSSQYNNQRVRAHDVLIRGADGRVIETRFNSDAFNVYPAHNQTYYPGEGAVFTARYLQHAPRTFVIVANDDSPWARGLRCDDLLERVNVALSKLHFAPEDARYKLRYDDAVAAARRAGCDLAE